MSYILEGKMAKPTSNLLKRISTIIILRFIECILIFFARGLKQRNTGKQTVKSIYFFNF